MAGKLDEISVKIGGLEANTETLQRTLSQHCIDDDLRHRENIAALRALNDTLAPLAVVVSAMEPLVKSYQVSRWKMIGALSVVTAMFVMVGWAMKAAIAGVIDAMLLNRH